MSSTKTSQSDDELRLYSREDLCDAPAISETQAVLNRAVGKGPRTPRPQRRGLLAISEATFDRWVANGEFPKPLKLGPRMVRWPARAVREWIEQQTATGK